MFLLALVIPVHVTWGSLFVCDL